MALGDGIRTLIQLKNKENDEIQQKARELLEKADHAETSWGKDQRISIIPSDEYHKLYGARAIDIAEKEILWYSQIERIPLVGTYYYEANKKALDRGIRYRSIAELSKPTNKILRFIEKYKKEFSGYEIRFAKPTLLVTFVLYDDKELNFSIENLPGVADSQILSTNNEQLIKVIKDYFELRWNSAMTEYPTKENNKTYNTKERS